MVNRILKSAYVLLSASACAAVVPASAQIHLTNAVVVGCNTDGSYVTLNDWHTNSLPSSAWNLWLINGSNLNGAFINGPDAAHAPIDLSLSAGSYTFTTFSNSISARPPYYGLNLSFNDPGKPDISAYAPAKTSISSTPAIIAIPSSVQTRLDDALVPGAGTLSFTQGNYTVTLTSFSFATPDVYGLDRTSPHSTSPNGTLDNIGSFTLQVTQVSSVPEPSAVALLTGATFFGGSLLLRRRK